MTKDWKSIRIKFQTSSGLPAPYSYYYTLELSPEADGVAVDLDLQYLDRDDLDEEMILEEGFSLNDDYRWTGSLPTIWQTHINRVLEHLEPTRKGTLEEHENYLEIEIRPSAGPTGTYVPSDRAVWDYFQQELIQAIYEASGKERDFEMEYLEIEASNELRIKINASFAQRSFSLQLNKTPPRSLDWKWTKEVMETVFKADFLPPPAPEDSPRFSGKYLEIGDGVWYEFNETLVEPSPKSKVLPQIVRLMDQLREEAIR